MKKNSKVVTSFEEAQKVAFTAARKLAKKQLIDLYLGTGDACFINLFRRDTFEFSYSWEFDGQKGTDTAKIKILFTDLISDEKLHVSMESAFINMICLGEQRITKGNKISTQKEQTLLPACKKDLQKSLEFVSNIEMNSKFNANISMVESVYQLVWYGSKEGNKSKGFNSFVKAVQIQLVALQYSRDVKNGFYDKQEAFLLPDNCNVTEEDEA